MSRQNTKDQVRCCAFEALSCVAALWCVCNPSAVSKLTHAASKPENLLRAAAGTPYEDGSFRMKMILGADFPRTPPKGVPQLCAYDTPKNTSCVDCTCGGPILRCRCPLSLCMIWNIRFVLVDGSSSTWHIQSCWCNLAQPAV